MGQNKNYSRFSKKQNRNNTIVDKETVNNDVLTYETQDNVGVGYVSGCKKLNVRHDSSIESKVVCVIDENTNVAIDITNSTDEFYKICTPYGIEGYCMKKYIKIK